MNKISCYIDTVTYKTIIYAYAQYISSLYVSNVFMSTRVAQVNCMEHDIVVGVLYALRQIYFVP